MEKASPHLFGCVNSIQLHGLMRNSLLLGQTLRKPCKTVHKSNQFSQNTGTSTATLYPKYCSHLLCATFQSYIQRSTVQQKEGNQLFWGSIFNCRYFVSGWARQFEQECTVSMV